MIKPKFSFCVNSKKVQNQSLEWTSCIRRKVSKWSLKVLSKWSKRWCKVLGLVNLCTSLIFFIVNVFITWGLWVFIYLKVLHVKILVSLFLYFISSLISFSLAYDVFIIFWIDWDMSWNQIIKALKKCDVFQFWYWCQEACNMRFWVDAMSYISWWWSVVHLDVTYID